jgi:hypothetical protein
MNSEQRVNVVRLSSCIFNTVPGFKIKRQNDLKELALQNEID